MKISLKALNLKILKMEKLMIMKFVEIYNWSDNRYRKKDRFNF